MLKIQNLRFQYKKNTPIIYPLNLNIKPGFTFLVGENGSGKTTLIKLLAGILPSTNSIFFNDIPCGTIEYKKALAYLPQDFELYPSLKVSEILQFVAGLRGIDKNFRHNDIIDVASKTNILDCMEKKYKTCSGGIKRRIGIACSLLGNPDLVLLDEPTVGIDPKERVQLYHTLQSCFTDKVVIVSTHILEDVNVLADNVIMLHEGKLVYYGEYQKFKSVLSGKIYTTNISISNLKAQFPNVILLTIQPNNNYVRVYSEKPLPVEYFNLTEATNEDIWMYYQNCIGDVSGGSMVYQD